MKYQKEKEYRKISFTTWYKKGLRHDRGVVSMPSSDIENPYKLASPYEFFMYKVKMEPTLR